MPHTFNCVSLSLLTADVSHLKHNRLTLLHSACIVSCVVRMACVFLGLFFVLGVEVFSHLTPLPNPSNPAVGPKTPQFLVALMGRSGLGKHRSSPLRCGRVVQPSSKGGDWPQVGWLSVIAMKTTSTCVVTSATPIASDFLVCG